MNAEEVRALLAGVGNDDLWRTNPVLCLDALIQQCRTTDRGRQALFGVFRKQLSALAGRGICVPQQALDRWVAGGLFQASATHAWVDEDPAPGVVGLATGDGGQGYALPLAPRPSPTGWDVNGDLPFTANDITGGLAALLRGSGIPDGGSVPERYAFRFGNPLGRRTRGDSMTVAALLSVIGRLAGGGSPVLRAAVSLVQFRGDTLEAVSDVPTKLSAAHRECGGLSLIVAPVGDVGAGLEAERVWRVGTVTELARRLHEVGLLAPLLDARGPLDRYETGRALDRLRRLVRLKHAYRDAADLGDRIRRCGLVEPADPATRVELARLHAEACRHHGRFGDAVAVSREAWEHVDGLKDLVCDDENADAAAEYAAGLFSGHRFGEIPHLLQPWAHAAAQEPRRFRTLTRVKVWNTLARALSVLEVSGWDELFARSSELNRGLHDEDEAARTAHYWAHAHLRRGDHSAALKVLTARPGTFPRAGDAWDAFLCAKTAQRQKEEWSDPELDRQVASGTGPYSVWLYVQAAARQKPRSREDAVHRLERAIELLRREAGGNAGNVCNLFASFLELYAAARIPDPARWSAADRAAADFLAHAPDHRAHYAPAIQRLPGSPDLCAAEALLERVPYF